MYEYQQESSGLQKLTGTISLTAQQAAVIKQTYILFGVSIFCALAGGYIGALRKRWRSSSPAASGGL